MTKQPKTSAIETIIAINFEMIPLIEKNPCYTEANKQPETTVSVLQSVQQDIIQIILASL